MKRNPTIWLLLLLILSYSQASAKIIPTIDAPAARDAILNGVTTIHSGDGPGGLVVYGDNAAIIAYYPEGATSGPMIGSAEWGSGRVIAVPDHQMLNMGNYGGQGDTGKYYKNSLAWLAKSSALTLNIITYDQETADWLVGQGYVNATKINEADLVTALASADLFVGWLGSTEPQANLDALATWVQNGGGLFIAEYGVGYNWWWGKPIYQAPGNLLLKPIGIGFTDGARGESGLIDATSRATVQVNLTRYYEIIADFSAASAEELDVAIHLLAHIKDSLPPDDPLPAQMAANFSSGVTATPSQPVTDPRDKQLLSAEMSILSTLPPNEVTAHPTAEELYGPIPAEAPRINRTVTIDTTVSRWHSTGIYAVPGEVVTINVPDSIINAGFSVIVSGHEDNISGRDTWLRVPYGVQRSYPINAASVPVANAFGGAIYIDVGTTPPATNGIANFDVTIQGGIAAPFFVLGQTTNADWNNNIRNNPAPYAEFVTPRIALSVPSSYIRTLSDPEQLMRFWDKVVEVQDYVGGFEDLRQMPERINIDVQISVGYLHAGYPIQGPTDTTSQLTDYDSILVSGSWGYYHELGHEMQRRPDKLWGGWDNPYTFNGDVEVTVNIFSNVALETMNPNTSTEGWGWSAYPKPVMERAIYTILTSGNSFDEKDPYPFYFQLADGFGWDTYRAVLKSYNDDVLNNPSALPTNNTEEKTQWLMRWSQISGYDMRCYMVNDWGLEVSLSAEQTAILDELPSCWRPIIGNTADRSVEAGSNTTLNFKSDALTLDGIAIVDTVSTPQYGTLQDQGNGSYLYTPITNESVSEVIYYTLQSSSGNTDTFSVTVSTVACSNPLVVTSVADSGACSLRTAVTNAPSNSTITFDPVIAGQTIYLSSPIVVTKNITIDGGAPAMTLSGDSDQNGSADVAIFDINSSLNVKLENLNITNGRSGEGAIFVRWYSTLTVSSVSFVNNVNNSWGGAIHSQGTVELYNATFSGNTSTQTGDSADIAIRGSGNKIYNTTFYNTSSNPSINAGTGTVWEMYNSILAGTVSCSGDVPTTQANNFAQDGACSATRSGDPKLGSLTQDTSTGLWVHQPMSGSPVLLAGDSATCLTADQLGFSRTSSCTLGSVELTSAVVPTSTPTTVPPTNTPMPTATQTPMPTATQTPMPTATQTPAPTATKTPLPTPGEVPTSVTVDQNNVTQATLLTPVVVVGLILSAVILWGVRRRSTSSL